MRRKSSTRAPASSAAAAAANSAAPTFTSFAAATAHALGAYPGSSMSSASAAVSTSHAPSQWDTDALQLLKKLSKRDATTKLRALSDLNAHVESLTELAPGIGSDFVNAWGPAFRASVLDDVSPAVRAALLNIMGLVVAKFRRLIQPIFPSILPVWLAAQGDITTSVAELAVGTLSESLPTPAHRRKVADRYGDDLRAYCVDVLGRLMTSTEAERFIPEARHVTAVLIWLVEAANSPAAVAPVIDNNSNHLMFLARGPKQKKKGSGAVQPSGALREACQLAVAVLAHMSLDDEADNIRALQFGEVALLGVRKSEPSAWDLVLVLLHDGWFAAFPNDFKKLGDSAGDAVTATFPTGLSALLPLFDALPERMVASAALAERLLLRMKKALSPSDANSVDSKQQVNVAYLLSALPTYIECASFAHNTGSSRWLEGQGTADRDQYAATIVMSHILPTFRLFISGQLPPVPKLQSNTSTANARRRPPANANNGVAHDLSIAIARSLQGLGKDTLLMAYQGISKSFVDSLDGRNPGEVVKRYLLLLNNMSESVFPCALATAVIQELMHLAVDQSLDVYVGALSSTLSNGASCNILSQHEATTGQNAQEFVCELMGYTKRILSDLNFQDDDKVNAVIRHVGEVYSWIHWASSPDADRKVWDQIMDDVTSSCEGDTWMYVLGETVQAHKRRREIPAFSSWSAVGGEKFEKAVFAAAEDMQADGSSYSLSLVAAASDPQGGADMPLPVLRRVAELVAAHIMSDSQSEIYDNLLIALLRSPVQYLETEGAFHKLLAVTILRAAGSEVIFSEMLSLLGRLPSSKIVDHVSRILSVISEQRSSPQSGTDNITVGRARVTARLIADICAPVGRDSVALCEEVLSWSSVPFTNELLRLVPMSFIFGIGEAMELRHARFLDVYEQVEASKEGSDVRVPLQAFVKTLSAIEKGSLARLATERILGNASSSLLEVLCVICSERSLDVSDWSLSSEGIARGISDVFPRTGQRTAEPFARVPNVVRLCVAESRGLYLESFRDLLQECVKIVRRDPLSANSLIALDILSASLAINIEVPQEEGVKARTRPLWLVESTALALLAVRRCLERSLSASQKELEKLETHSATFFSSAVRALGVEALGEDDLRFWALRAKDILQSYVYDDAARENSTLESCKRLASLSVLGSALVELDESMKVARSDMMYQLCHSGAWAGVKLLPMAENSRKSLEGADISLMELGSRSASALILKAAEKGVLLNADGSIPVDITGVYSLAPLLSSRASSTRKAILTLLAYAAAIDLPDTVSNAFPKEGFADEAKEVRFVTDLVPKQLRLALEWPKSPEMSKESEEYAARELGYFLAWRLFLDLIRADDAVGGSALLGDVQEDVSFRRVGITFLRSRPELYAEFFDKCVEVVVDGKMTERVAAGAAAAEALQVEERAAQGAQLVQQQEAQEEAEPEERQLVSGSEMDKEVGKAAGIAFARALQRLPALSRQLVTDRLDRGTALRVESFVRKKISPLLIAAEIRKVKEWGAFGGGPSSSSAGEAGNVPDLEGEGELHARGSVAGREVWATYTFSDVTLEIGMRLPDVFPLNTVEVEARSRIGMSEARWRKTLLGMTTLLRAKDGTLAEAVELWRRNLDKTFQGAEECPICYSVLHLTTAALPRMQCRTCKNLFHSECLCKWFTKSNSSACPLCRSAF